MAVPAEPEKPEMNSGVGMDCERLHRKEAGRGKVFGANLGGRRKARYIQTGGYLRRERLTEKEIEISHSLN